METSRLLNVKAKLSADVDPKVYEDFKKEVNLRKVQNKRAAITIATEVNEALIIYTRLSKDNKLSPVGRPMYDFSNIEI